MYYLAREFLAILIETIEAASGCGVKVVVDRRRRGDKRHCAKTTKRRMFHSSCVHNTYLRTRICVEIYTLYGRFVCWIADPACKYLVNEGGYHPACINQVYSQMKWQLKLLLVSDKQSIINIEFTHCSLTQRDKKEQDRRYVLFHLFNLLACRLRRITAHVKRVTSPTFYLSSHLLVYSTIYCLPS